MSAAVKWSVEFLPHNPAARVRFLERTEILVYIMGLGLCPLSVFCPVLSLAKARIFC